MVKVLIADDHTLVRQGIRALLERASEIEVVGEAGDGRQALELVERLAPDVLLIDVTMPQLSGLEALPRVRAISPATQVVILTVHTEESFVVRALRSGARGYVLKHAAADELLLAVRAAARGETYLTPAVAGPVLEELMLRGPEAATNPLERLSAREREVLQLIVEGRTNTAIASLLNLSIKTVEKHRANTMRKLGVHDVAGLIHVAIQEGLPFAR